MFGYTGKVRAIVFAVNIAIIAIFTAAGWWLDQKYGTKPKFIFGAVIISFPVTQFALYRLLTFKEKK